MLHRTAAVNDSGIGLGLTAVKKIVEHSGGFVTASSPGLGRGSTFFFCMNMQAADNENRTENSIAPKDDDVSILGPIDDYSQELHHGIRLKRN